MIENRQTAPAMVVTTEAPYGHAPLGGYTWLRLVIHEGRKRQVRLMCAAVAHPVRQLVRTRIGPVELGTLAVKRTRPLSTTELTALRAVLKL